MLRSLRTFLILTAAMCATVSASAQTYATAREVLEANLEATGGAEAWSGITSVTRSGSRVLGTPDGERGTTFTEYLKYPGYSRTEETINGPMGPMEQLIISTPEERWTQSMTGKRVLPERKWIASDLAKDELFLLKSTEVKLGPLEKEIGESGPVYVVVFEFDGQMYRRKYDQDSLFLLAAEAPGNDGSKSWSTFSDYREIAGFKTPFNWNSTASITMNRNGQMSTSAITVATTLEKITFNDRLSDGLFIE